MSRAAVRMTREKLHRRGYKPGDGKGGIVPAGKARDPLDSADGRTCSEPIYGDKVQHWTPDGGLSEVKPAIRVPKRSGPNATEKRWADDNAFRFRGFDLRYEAITFRLASSALYTPDWTTWDGCKLHAVIECKGAWGHGSHSRSALAWKTAASEWPAVTFIWARWKDGKWQETQINPAS